MSDTTLGRATATYVNARWARGEITKETKRSFNETLRLFAANLGRDRRLKDVQRRDVEQWLGSMTCSSATKRLRLSSLKGFFQWCVIEGLVRSDPTLGIRGPKKVRSIPRGLADEDAERVIRGAVDARERVILVLGTIEPRKAQTLITQAFEQVANNHEDALLVLVGDTQSPYSTALKEYIASEGLTKRVRMVPVVSDTYIWYRAADIFVCGSDIESLPRSVLEVMAFEVPVVATAVFGLPELIVHGETGWLYEARSLSSAVKAFNEVLSLSSKELERVGKAGRQHVLEHHDSRSYAAEIPDLLVYLGTHPGSLAEEALEAIRCTPGSRARVRADNGAAARKDHSQGDRK